MARVDVVLLVLATWTWYDLKKEELGTRIHIHGIAQIDQDSFLLVFRFEFHQDFSALESIAKPSNGSNTSKNGFPLDANANLKVCEFAKANLPIRNVFYYWFEMFSGRFVEVQILAGPLDSIATKTAPGVAEAGLAPGINRQPKLGGSNSLRWTACSWKNCLHLIRTTHWTSKMVSEDEGELL